MTRVENISVEGMYSLGGVYTPSHKSLVTPYFPPPPKGRKGKNGRAGPGGGEYI